MTHTDEVLAEIVAANETVCQARSEMNLAKTEASIRSKDYAEAVDNLTMAIPGRESPTPLFDQAEAVRAAAEVPPVRSKGHPRTRVPFPEGVCRVCGCTEDEPCPGGCSWADKTRTLCTRCANGKPKPGQGEGLCGGPPEPDYFPPFTGDKPAVRSEAQADQEIYNEVRPPRRRGRKPGRKSTKKHRKTRRK